MPTEQTATVEPLATEFRWLSIAEFNRGLHKCDRCGQPAIYVRSDDQGFAVKACTLHRVALSR